jgi:hypothetical protein
MQSYGRLAEFQQSSALSHENTIFSTSNGRKDANSGHAFGILLAAVGALRPSGSGAS